MNIEILQSKIILENEKVLLIPFENEKNIELKSIIFDEEIWKYMGIYVRNDVYYSIISEDWKTTKKEYFSEYSALNII